MRIQTIDSNVAHTSQKLTDKAPDGTATFQKTRNLKCTSLQSYRFHSQAKAGGVRFFIFWFSKLVTRQDNTGGAQGSKGL